MEDKQKVRESGPDLLRVIAAVFVIGVHFYLNCGYYSAPLISTKLYIMTAARWLFLICVPLYMMLTGYFKSEKTISKSHYLSLIPIAFSYVGISVIKMIMCNFVYGKVYTLSFAVRNILNYQIAWYMGMYLSLMLILPFLNKMWKACSGRREHNIMIASFAFVSMCYPVFLYIAPSYWQMLYPIVYYFLGIYIKEYRPKVKKWILLIVIIVTVTAEAVVSIIAANGNAFIWNVLGPVDSGYSTITVAVTAVSMFLLIYDLDVRNSFIKKVLANIAGLSFEIYLFSAAYDAIVFYYLKRYIYNAEDFFWIIFISVPASFLLAWLSSFIYRQFYLLIRRLFIKCRGGMTFL